MMCCTLSSTPTLRTFLSVQAYVNQVSSTTAGQSLKATQIKLAWRNLRTTSTKEQKTTLQLPWALDFSASTYSCSILGCTLDPRELILLLKKFLYNNRCQIMLYSRCNHKILSQILTWTKPRTTSHHRAIKTSIFYLREPDLFHE